MGIIIRNDDVNPNTDYRQLMEIYDIIESRVPEAEIMTVWCPTCCYKPNSNHIYPASMYPLRQRETSELMMMANHVGLPLEGGRYHKVASHGLYHVVHKNLPRDLQAASIVGSCELLRTGLFVPPFSEIDDVTEDVCRKNQITLIAPSKEWKSLESEPFDPSHKYWFFHSWRFTPEQFRKVFDVSVKVG